MKWMKHMTATWDDEKISRLVAEHGLAGYGLWWRVAEIVAANLDGSAEPEVTYPLTKWSHLMSLRGSHVFKTLLTLQVTHLVTLVRTGDDITVRIPNLLKYRDEYSRKSGHSPDNVRSKNRTEQIQKENTEHTHTPQAPSMPARTNGRVRVTDLNGQTSQRFEEFWDRYPRQQHRDEACQQWLSVVTIEVEPALFACLQRYLDSDEVARGAVCNPEKWLQEQHRDAWKGNWPRMQPAAQNRRESAMDAAMRIAKERQNGTH